MAEKQDLKILYRVIPGILISVIALVTLISLIDLDTVREAVKQVTGVTVLAAVGLVIISLFARAFAWRGILLERISLWQSYLIINAGYLINTVLPFRLGEISRAFLLLPSGLGFWEALPSIFLERLLDIGFALSMLFIGLPYALGFSDDLIYPAILGGTAVGAIVVLLIVVKYQDRILAWLEGLPLKNEQTQSGIVRFVKSIISSLQILTDPLQTLKVVLGMGVGWCIALGFQYLLLLAFVPEAPLGWAAFGLGAVAIGVSVPSSPGNIGLYEGSLTLALTACGMDASLAFTYALTSHVINLGITTGFGAYGLVREGIGLRDVWQFGLQGRKGTGYE